MEKHKSEAPKSVKIAVVTISTSKFDFLWSKNLSLEETADESGKLIIKKLKDSGHEIVFYTIVPDHEGLIVEMIDHIIETYNPDVIITTGGTGITSKDVTIEALESIFDKKIEGFGELFRRISIEKVGYGALISRATAGVVDGVAIFALPGSPNAVEIGMEIILKEITHIVKHAKE